jgi:hypothetical protein
MIYATVFDEWGKAISDFFTNLDPLNAWAWILIICGIAAIFVLIFFTEFKRAERDSMKFTAIILVVASVLLGLGLHFLLTYIGLW